MMKKIIENYLKKEFKSKEAKEIYSYIYTYNYLSEELATTREENLPIIRESNSFCNKIFNSSQVELSKIRDGFVKRANIAFAICSVSFIVGLILIIISIIYFLLINASLISTVPLISGIITEFIAATFFQIFKLTENRVKEITNDLNKIENVNISYQLIKSVTDNNVKNDMINNLVRIMNNAS